MVLIPFLISTSVKPRVKVTYGLRIFGDAHVREVALHLSQRIVVLVEHLPAAAGLLLDVDGLLVGYLAL